MSKMPSRQEILENVQMKIAISYFKKEDKKVYKKSIAQIAAIIVLCIGLATSVVYASVIVYQNIMKEPDKLESFYTSKESSSEGIYLKSTLSKEEEDSSLSQDAAKEKAKVLLQKFGYSDEEIIHMRLLNSSSNYDTQWYIETNHLRLVFDAKADNFLDFSTDILSRNVENYRTTEEEAKKIGIELCKKYGYQTDDYTSIVVESNAPNNEDKAYIWSVTFCKEYDSLKNPYESIQISFIPEINALWRFRFTNHAFENNELVISEETAKSIAIQNDKKVEPDYEIAFISLKLSIVQMNPTAYFRQEDYATFYNSNGDILNSTFYRCDNRIRKAWLVTIEHKPNPSKDDDTNQKHKGFIYYIDATTGEIIGGDILY